MDKGKVLKAIGWMGALVLIIFGGVGNMVRTIKFGLERIWD